MTLLKWALSKGPDGKHNKQTANQLLADAIVSDRTEVDHALAVITQDVIKQATVAIQAGADGIYYSTQVIQDDRLGHQDFVDIVEKYDRQIIRAANELSDTNILHICGNGGARNPLAWFKNYENAVINWATDNEQVSLRTGQQIFTGKVVLGGLGNTVNDVLYRGNRLAITAAVQRLVEEAGSDKVIIGANCKVPRDIDIQHLQWAVQAARF